MVFSDLIPAEALDTEDLLQKRRKRQVLLPDFKLDLSGPTGEIIATLEELKTILKLITILIYIKTYTELVFS